MRSISSVSQKAKGHVNIGGETVIGFRVTIQQDNDSKTETRNYSFDF
jgi:hypothetical protein